MQRLDDPIKDCAPQPNLGFIFGPLRDLFENQSQGLTRTLKQLAVLETRFRRMYSREEEIDWTRCFDTNIHFFDYVTIMSPQDLANSLTIDDIAAFNSLRPESITKEDMFCRRMHIRWNKLCRAAPEIIATESALSPRLVKLAKVSLFILRCSIC